MVRIRREIRRVVEHDQRQDHLLERDLVHRDPLLVEMRRRIDVGAVLPDHLVDRGAETVVLDRVGLLRFRIGGGRHLGLAEARPHRRRGVEAVREIDELFALNDAIGALERARGKRGCAERSGKRCEGKDGDNAKHRCHDGPR